MNSFSKIATSVFVGLIGGMVFTLLHLPLAWLLGSLFAIVIWKLVLKKEAQIHPSMRNGSLVIIGYMLGISFTYDTLIQMTKMLPAMLMSTLLLIGFSIFISIFLARFTGISFKTAIIGMMPGGFSQMVILGEEIEDVDVTSVTLFQLIRLLSVIYLVPAIVRIDWFSHIGSSTTFELGQIVEANNIEILLFVVVTIISTWLAVRFRFPTPYLLGPLLGSAIFVISGFTPFQLPNWIIVVSQLFLGIHVGIMVDPNKLKNWKRFGVGAIVSSVALLVSTVSIAFFLVWLYPVSLGTSFLSSAPGGIAEMGLTAVAIGADMSIVTGFQMFRVFFVLLVVPPLLLWIFKRDRIRLKRSS
ncbi:AbrB family transcriptional regulator [Bacillus suaedaesalsae]|uniref:AbrB family transcriptional regulator n=1 Tax=Bacillus suaedaesalsae TaxID=2810349 RepID=A0ABS2DJY0_9BACI|nr:AbrB family transcriptional regulator [Bacillus suaedaesalsae]MBM6618804.1 AbrB family transcriptional regulator [Bacillus suaedaesalsae]